jgi:flavin reductase ActVB
MELDTFKAGMSRFASGVTIITTRDSGGAPAGFTASSFTSLSLDPPLVLFCLDRESYCFDAFYGAENFGVNILSSEQQSLSKRFSRRGGDKFEGLALLETKTGVPLLQGCLVNMECRVTERLPGGDHLIFLGEVQHVEIGEGSPLIFCMGKYHNI